jgi:aminomethyltransferase
MMNQPQRTILYDRHLALQAQIVEFGGWSMPIQYPAGIVQEHLATRKRAGLFDVSHMGRFIVRGRNAVPFLQAVLSNDAARLHVGQSHYTIIPNAEGGAIDDAYLYRFVADEFVLVVNAANRQKDWEHFQMQLRRFDQVELVDQTDALAMISLQGPASLDMLSVLKTSGEWPAAARNALGTIKIRNIDVWLARTGYTGEPVCFELFLAGEHAGVIWDLLVAQGAQPVGLGARDTLRLEAGLPLYGHELGVDADGRDIPILAAPASRIAVRLAPVRGDFIGRSALEAQMQALQAILAEDHSQIDALPRRVRAVALLDKGIARAGCPVWSGARQAGYITSGTMIPYWKFQGTELSEETGKRAIGLALIDSTLCDGADVLVDIRGKLSRAKIVSAHLSAKMPPYARPVLV